MDLKQRLESCKKCDKRKFGDTGIVCSLTGNKPTFAIRCNDFEMDAREAQKIIAKAKYNDYSNSNYNSGSTRSNSSYAEEETSNPIWVFIGILIAVIKLIFMFA